MFRVPEKYRFNPPGVHFYHSSIADGNNGCFRVRSVKFKSVFEVIASDGEGWEHVSVSVHNRCPTWEEMCYIKGLFWAPEDFVVQMHVPEDEWVNNHPFCLHLWRKADSDDYCERPTSILVGI